MKKVLMLAYIFPPLGGSGVQRTTKFARYLPQFGWQPLVVCGDDPEAFATGYDHTLAAELPPEVKVYRRPYVSPLGLRRRFQRRMGIKRIDEQALTMPAVSIARPGDLPGSNEPRPSAWRWLARQLAAPLSPLEFPPIDAGLYWALAIVPLCRQIIKKEGVELIFSTSFPYSDHLAGYILHLQTGLPWVADFRDPFSLNASARNTGWRRKADEWLEQRVLNNASRVVAVTPTYTQDFRSLAPRRAAQDFLTITNGFDTADFDAEVPAAGESVLPPSTKATVRARLAHVGMIYDGTALPFFEAAASLDSKDQARLDTTFIGGLPAPEAAWVAANRLRWSLHVTGRVPHARAVQAMRAADAVLLPVGLDGKWKGHLPGKLFEYLHCGAPILLVGPADGDAAQIVSECGVGVCASDARSAAQALRLLACDPAAFRARYYRPRPEVIARYERRALTGRLAETFDQLITEHRAHA